MAYKQAQNRRKKLMKTYEETKNCYGSGVWFNDEKGFYIKCTASNTPGYAKYLRRVGNRKVRHSKELHNHGTYRRMFDYKWALY